MHFTVLQLDFCPTTHVVQQGNLITRHVHDVRCRQFSVRITWRLLLLIIRTTWLRFEFWVFIRCEFYT